MCYIRWNWIARALAGRGGAKSQLTATPNNRKGRGGAPGGCRRKSTGGILDRRYRFSIPSLDEVAGCSSDLASRMASYYPPPQLSTVMPPDATSIQQEERRQARKLAKANTHENQQHQAYSSASSSSSVAFAASSRVLPVRESEVSYVS
jgi:hypothetical protein